MRLRWPIIEGGILGGGEIDSVDSDSNEDTRALKQDGRRRCHCVCAFCTLLPTCGGTGLVLLSLRLLCTGPQNFMTIGDDDDW